MPLYAKITRFFFGEKVKQEKVCTKFEDENWLVFSRQAHLTINLSWKFSQHVDRCQGVLNLEERFFWKENSRQIKSLTKALSNLTVIKKIHRQIKHRFLAMTTLLLSIPLLTTLRSSSLHRHLQILTRSYILSFMFSATLIPCTLLFYNFISSQLNLWNIKIQ